MSLRQWYDLYANVRPIKTFKGAPAPLGDVDFVVLSILQTLAMIMRCLSRRTALLRNTREWTRWTRAQRFLLAHGCFGISGAADGADAIIRATEQTIAEGTTTHDLGGSASMSQMTDAIIGHLNK